MGLTLNGDGLGVSPQSPRLAWFPFVSGVVWLAFLVVFLGVAFELGRVTPEGGALVWLVLVCLVLTFVSSFFNAAPVHCGSCSTAGGSR